MTARLPITVAVPTFNGSRYLAETLRSILPQADVAFDLLVSDDRSTDDTVEIARTIAGDRVRVVINAERLGLAGNWNQCVQFSQTPLVAIIHQDDLLRPGHLAAHVQAFGSDSLVGLVASASGVIDEQSREIPPSVIDRGGLGPSNRLFKAGEALSDLARANPLRCSAVSLRAEAIASVGGFDPNYRYVVDWDCWLRLARQWSLAWLANPSVDVRWHLASETHRFRTGIADLQESERVVSALLDDLTARSIPTAALSQAARRTLSRAYLNRAHVALRAGLGEFGRDCLNRSLKLWPGILRVIASDPRLATQMAALWAAPGPSSRWFHRADNAP